LIFELIADLAHLIGLCFSTRVLEVDQLRARFPEDIVAAVLPPCVPESGEEVADVIEVDAGVTLACLDILPV
jgi:hypothetical protein